MRLSLSLSLMLIAASAAVADPPKKVTPPKGTPPKKGGVAPRGGVSQAVVATDLTLIRELQHAHHVLDKADPIYAGHRGHAMKEINHAIGLLQSEIKARGMKQHHHEDGVTLPKIVSHALVVQSANQLAVVLKQLQGLPKSPNRTKAAGHLVKAVQEMDKGLRAAKASGK